jgi:glucose/arabinose dehydrogenase
MGKIHRLDPVDGSAPADNPFFNNPGAVRTIWTYGNRNSFDFTWDPVNSSLFFTENGPTCDDEVNIGRAGGNYGWPDSFQGSLCQSPPPGSVAPVYVYPTPVGITGINFYRGAIPGWRNTLFWCAVNNGQLYHARSDPTRTLIESVSIVSGAPSCSTDVLEGPDGSLYVASNAIIARIGSNPDLVRTTFLPLVNR